MCLLHMPSCQGDIDPKESSISCQGDIESKYIHSIVMAIKT